MNLLIICLIGYALGNISNAFIIGKLFLNKDVRDFGSGNAGATNALRAFGAKIGILVFILDIFKGVIAVILGRYLNPEVGQYFAGLFVIIGHNWPIVLKFKGGKGIATSIGVIFVINPVVSLVCFVIGISIAFFTRLVSLGSLAGIILVPIVIVIFFRPININFLIFSIILAAMAIFRHRSNILRLIKGEENKLGKKDWWNEK